MHNYGLRQFGRTILTVTGILLLVIFGSRAASQATSLSAVGGQPKHSLYPIDLTASQLVAIAGNATQQSATGSYEIAIPGSSTSENQTPMQASGGGKSLANAAGQLKQTASELADEANAKITDTALTTKLNKTNSQQELLQAGVK